MDTGTLTPRSGTVIDAMRFSGPFDQPDGFASVLTVTIRRSGEACLTLNYRSPLNVENMWSIMLTEDQRNALGNMLCQNQSRTYERFEP